MPPANLQGLNIVHPVQDTDSHDLLLGQSYPDLTAQLDLWTNLTFDSEEPLPSRHEEHQRSALDDEEEEEIRSPVTGEKAVHDGHVNVVTPTNVTVNQSVPHQAPPTNNNNLFDINSFLANFGIDPFNASSNQLQQQPTAIAPSLAQLLALHPGSHAPYAPPMPHYTPAPVPPTFTSPTATSSTDDHYAPAKRARTRKMSVTSVDSPDFREESVPPTGLSPAEDKRRRNTAASARFRLKKKEREAALEGKAKELETKVAELERECEGLRRENGWLKGLVVGVTGAAQAPNNAGLTVTSPPPGPITSTPAGSKRRRDDGTA
jgi:hypothetical protein